MLGRATGYAGGEGQLVANEVPSDDDWGMGKGFNKWALQTARVYGLRRRDLCRQRRTAGDPGHGVHLCTIFPIAFINNHFLYYILKVVLFIGASGVGNACWPLSWLLSWSFGLKKDPFDDDSISQSTSPADGLVGGWSAAAASTRGSTRTSLTARSP